MKHWYRISFTLFSLSILFWGCASVDTSSSKDILVAPRKGKFEVIVTSTGELQAQKSTRIFGPRGGRQLGIYQMKISHIIPEGTRVKKGAPIAELDKSEVMGKIAERKLALDKSQSLYTQTVLDTALTLSEARDNIANLKYAMQENRFEMEQSIYEAPATQNKLKLAYEKAERTYEQAISNYQKRIAQSVAKVKEVESDLKKEQNRYNDLLKLLQEFSVMAPEDGMLIYFREWNGRKRVAGSTISPWEPIIATLPDLSVMESITFINEIDIQKVSKGQKVKVGLDAVADKYLQGKITSVANIGEQRPGSDSKVFEVVIAISDSDTTLRPAMTTSNEIMVNSLKEAVYIPLECLHVQDSTNYVYKKVSEKTVKQEIVPGLMNENHVEIKAGVSMEDQVYLSIPVDTTGLVLEKVSTKGISSVR